MWPNSDQLTLSEVSECGSFMAMGLRNGTVVVWDIYRGEGFVCVRHKNSSKCHFQVHLWVTDTI